MFDTDYRKCCCRKEWKILLMTFSKKKFAKYLLPHQEANCLVV